VDGRRASWRGSSLEGCRLSPGEGGPRTRSIVATLYAQQEKLHHLELRLRHLQTAKANLATSTEQLSTRGCLASLLEDVAKRLDAVGARLQALPCNEPARLPADALDQASVQSVLPPKTADAGFHPEPVCQTSLGFRSPILQLSPQEQGAAACRPPSWQESTSGMHPAAPRRGLTGSDGPAPLPGVAQRLQAARHTPPVEDAGRDMFQAMGRKAPQPRDVAVPCDRDGPEPAYMQALTGPPALPERRAPDRSQPLGILEPAMREEHKDPAVGPVFQAPPRYAQHTSSPLPALRSDAPCMVASRGEWLEPLTMGAADPGLQEEDRTPHLPVPTGRWMGQALLGEEPREFDPDVLWAK
ncbi:faeC, partial [Symbiodinium pilosum]